MSFSNGRPKCVSFRIRKVYYDQIVSGSKRFELRTLSDFWRKRLLGDNPPRIAVFLCGKRVHRRYIISISTIRRAEIPFLLNRDPSEQGVKDLNLDKNDKAIVVWLGNEFNSRLS